MKEVDKASEECSHSYNLLKTLQLALYLSIVTAGAAAPESKLGSKAGYTLTNPTPKELIDA